MGGKLVKKSRIVARSALCVFASGFIFASGIGASTLLSPKGRFSTLFYNLEYDPSRACSEPYKPFSRDQYALDRYRNDAVEYIACMKRAATSDAEYATEVIYDGYKKKAEEFINELR